MAEEFILDVKVDQPAMLAGRRDELYAIVTIKPNILKLGALLENVGDVTLSAHLIVVVDVSGSMEHLIRDDPHARVVGETVTEGNSVRVVETTVPSRINVAIQTVKRLSERMGPSDRMTLVAFDHTAHPLITAAAPGTQLTHAIDQLAEFGFGGTSMGRGLQAVADALRPQPVPNSTQKLVVLTDGEDQEPDFALEQARILGEQFHIPIHAFGTGESVGPFLADICKTTFGQFRNIRDEHEAESFFDDVLTGQKNILATKVKLTLWLSPEILVQELYRTKPEILFRGKLKPNENNQLDIDIVYMERGKAYEFLFRCEVPARDAGRFRLAKASLYYDIPALSITGQKAEANIVVEYTPDTERAQVRVGEVRRIVSQAEIQRQVLFLDDKCKLVKSGQGTEKDKLVISRMIETLIKKYEEFGDQANRNIYEQMREEFRKNGTISQQTLNQSLAASSKVEENVAIQEIDDF